MRKKEQSICLLVVTLLFIHQSQATDESSEGVDDESWQRDNHHEDHDHESNQTGNEIFLHTLCNQLISYIYSRLSKLVFTFIITTQPTQYRWIQWIGSWIQ